MDIETGSSPSYEEIVERFGDNIAMEDAIEETAYFQRKYPELTAIGSVLASEELYGAKNIRQTTRALDFAADPKTIREMNEEYGESWSYGGTHVFAVDKGDEEWMVAAIPCNEEVFTDSGFEPFCVDSYSIMNPDTIETSKGDINAVSPELGVASKFRRYMMQKANRGSYKRSDLVDIVNIAAENRSKDFIDYFALETLMRNQVGSTPNGETLKDAAESLAHSEADSELGKENIEAGFRELRELLE